MYINNEKIIDNAIEIQYRKLQDNIDDGYISLYGECQEKCVSFLG